MRDERGKFIVSRPISGLMKDVNYTDIKESQCNVHWYVHYTMFFHGHRKDRNIHLGSITNNVASVLVF